MTASEYRLSLKAQCLANGVGYPIDVTTTELERLAFGIKPVRKVKPKTSANA